MNPDSIENELENTQESIEEVEEAIEEVEDTLEEVEEELGDFDEWQLKQSNQLMLIASLMEQNNQLLNQLLNNQVPLQSQLNREQNQQPEPVQITIEEPEPEGEEDLLNSQLTTRKRNRKKLRLGGKRNSNK